MPKPDAYKARCANPDCPNHGDFDVPRGTLRDYRDVLDAEDPHRGHPTMDPFPWPCPGCGADIMVFRGEIRGEILRDWP